MRKIEKSENICKYIEESVIDVIVSNNLINNNDKIIVAVSGGPDSMCLLNILYTMQDYIKNKYNLTYALITAHVNHMIRAEAEDEKVYVKKFCDDRNIKFCYLKEDIPKLSKQLKISEETCGRKVRYEFFEKLRQEEKANSIAVAHNLDDNVETILLNIIRGCGLKGLIGMEYKFNYLIRPLLTIEKKDILLYNEMCNLNSCHDSTNDLDIYSRNKVRHNLIPELKENYNNNFSNNIIRMSKLLSQDENFLAEYTNNIINNSIIENTNNVIKFDYSLVLKEHEAIKNRFVRKIIEFKLGNLDGIESIHVYDIVKLLEKNIKGKKYIIGNKFELEIVSKYHAIIY